jgi:hypothetical protein
MLMKLLKSSSAFGTFRASRDVQHESVLRVEADIRQRL